MFFYVNAIVLSGSYVSHVSAIKSKFLQNPDSNMSGDSKVNGNADLLIGKEKFSSAKKVDIYVQLCYKCVDFTFTCISFNSKTLKKLPELYALA